MMTLSEVMQQLEAQGTEQNRKVYLRHGIREPMFGVSYAHLGALVREIRRDHALAMALWGTGNHDARVLATMIADPGQVNVGMVDEWRASLDNYVLTDALSKLAAQASLPQDAVDSWCASDHEWTASLGWSVVGQQAMEDSSLGDDYFLAKLATIEREIHQRANRVRHTMNGALIAIGMRNDRLQALALETAARIGPVVVDHGETDCKTPDAAQYIRRSAERAAARMQAAAAPSTAAIDATTPAAPTKTQAEKLPALQAAPRKIVKRAARSKAKKAKRTAVRSKAKPAPRAKAAKAKVAKRGKGKTTKRGKIKAAGRKKATSVRSQRVKGGATKRVKKVARKKKK